MTSFLNQVILIKNEDIITIRTYDKVKRKTENRNDVPVSSTILVGRARGMVGLPATRIDPVSMNDPVCLKKNQG